MAHGPLEHFIIYGVFGCFAVFLFWRGEKLLSYLVGFGFQEAYGAIATVLVLLFAALFIVLAFCVVVHAFAAMISCLYRCFK